MSTTIAVYARHREIPDGTWLANAVHGMAPTLDFVEGFEPLEDGGRIPCRLGGRDCGFEWECDAEPELPEPLRAQQFDMCLLLSYRSSADDAACATLVAANLAHIAGGVLETPAGERIDGFDALHWASDVLQLNRRPVR